jgi:hypothetical protein
VGRGVIDPPVVDEYLSALGRVSSEDGFDKFGSARARQPCYPDHLAGVKLEADIFEIGRSSELYDPQFHIFEPFSAGRFPSVRALQYGE